MPRESILIAALERIAAMDAPGPDTCERETARRYQMAAIARQALRDAKQQAPSLDERDSAGKES